MSAGVPNQKQDPHTKIWGKTDGLGTLLEDEVGTACTRLQRELGFICQPHHHQVVDHMTPALTPNRCRKSQLYFILRPRISFRHPSLHLLPALPHAPQGTQSGRQVLETSVGDKWETSVNSCGPRHPEWETSVGDKGETSANSCCPRNPEWETSVGDKCKIRLSKTHRVGDKCGRHAENKCNLMRPKAPKCEGQVGDKCKIMRPKAPRVGDKWETSVNSCGPRHPE